MLPLIVFVFFSCHEHWTTIDKIPFRSPIRRPIAQHRHTSRDSHFEGWWGLAYVCIVGSLALLAVFLTGLSHSPFYGIRSCNFNFVIFRAADIEDVQVAKADHGDWVGQLGIHDSAISNLIRKRRDCHVIPLIDPAVKVLPFAIN